MWPVGSLFIAPVWGLAVSRPVDEAPPVTRVALGTDAVRLPPVPGQPELVGYLSRPPGPGPFPAVVLLHGCGGMRSNEVLWRAYFTNLGFVTLAVDSLRPRGLRQICTGAGQVTWSMRAADAFAALDYLAELPFVRSDKVVVMGFSHGAGIALDVVTASRIEARPPEAPRFAATVAFYPGCSYVRRQMAEYRAPVLILVGDADDWTPATECRKLAERHPDQIELRVYPGAMHAFDVLEWSVTHLPDAVNRHSPTGKGATVGGDAKAVWSASLDIWTCLSQNGLLGGRSRGRPPRPRPPGTDLFGGTGPFAGAARFAGTERYRFPFPVAPNGHAPTDGHPPQPQRK